MKKNNLQKNWDAVAAYDRNYVRPMKFKKLYNRKRINKKKLIEEAYEEILKEAFELYERGEFHCDSENE